MQLTTGLRERLPRGDPSRLFGRPRRAIDGFESVFGDRQELLLSNGRKFYRKLAA